MKNKHIALGAFFMLVAVALGAFGAHGLKGKIDTASLENWKTGVHYQSIHGLGILLCTIIGQDEKVDKVQTWLFSLGILLFSGSLYLLSCKTLLGIPNIGQYIWFTTPLGGLLFILGWLRLIVKSLKKS